MDLGFVGALLHTELSNRACVLNSSTVCGSNSLRYGSVNTGVRKIRASTTQLRMDVTGSEEKLASKRYVQKKPHELEAWKVLESAAKSERPHLREMLDDLPRCLDMFLDYDGIVMDYSRQLITKDEKELLLNLAKESNLKQKINAMFHGDVINVSEMRSVLHTALRMAREDSLVIDGEDVVKQVYSVLDQIKSFTDKVRSGEHVGVTGKPLTDVVAIGIGGSFLGPAFVHTGLETEPSGQMNAAGRKLRFLANVDPEDVSRALSGLNAETTLVVVISKTFTTAETMLNARTVRAWLKNQLGSSQDVVAKHMVAVSTNIKLVTEFGISAENTFGFWDWVGGRYSVSSAVGVLPLALQYGYDTVDKFLAGMRSVDTHFKSAPLEKNLPVMMGLLAVWNATFLDFPTNALLPYDQALSKLSSHIQQVSMESNGKGVFLDGQSVPFKTGEVIFGEPGTNGQHSFYQLIHQGRVVPCDFIGICVGQQAVYLDGESVSNHDELMSNFFAQADALAYGRTAEEVIAEEPGLDKQLVPHKVFTGNRPSISILLPTLTAYEIGQLLALYEHRIAVQGFIWGINSFDQWGVELGKKLATKMRSEMSAIRRDGRPVNTAGKGFNYSTTRLLQEYLSTITEKRALLYKDAFQSPFEYFNACMGESCSTEDQE
uniref:Glucose-6-phosphate isomerase n=1 Tax=Timspurckia oligopyrenoides TaxID=708627 RepID=A0A7S0ZB90_9RHOD|mmetsp:Transcript_11004/g.19885  ORF Transcript_11004/g.19885 Transcript_11004/m.19885 type:complete len:660 (+) Transcript_11004:86-2065(+)|eukprot:CAMPEP_0182445000 /NCGR_PEP_ID=MMETSP1172-20130603/3268_1 /TAXON_ID=708627 /ORGANISM="Timspurckia oligopyrenoides, Strain CCMP3278" /LENGTH=659 /DNA_ID=CAMNT_0024640685 /DNA_START=45 /DNA_END=2024 /DNA_ORIENTATION=-